MHEVTVLPLWMFHTAGVLLGQSSTGECPSWGGHSATPSDKIWGEKTALWAFPKPGWAQPVPGLAAPSLAQKTSGLVPSEVFPALVEQQDMGQGFSCSPLTPLLPPLGVGTIAGCKRVLHCLHPIPTWPRVGVNRGAGDPQSSSRGWAASKPHYPKAQTELLIASRLPATSPLSAPTNLLIASQEAKQNKTKLSRTRQREGLELCPLHSKKPCITASRPLITTYQGTAYWFCASLLPPLLSDVCVPVSLLGPRKIRSGSVASQHQLGFKSGAELFLEQRI